MITIPIRYDVILVRGILEKSTDICILQSIKMHNAVSYSHVILSLGNGGCIHATTEKENDKVKLIRLTEVWNSKKYEQKKLVLRNKNIDETVLYNDENFSDFSKFVNDALTRTYDKLYGWGKN